jgi:hypothetical protein
LVALVGAPVETNFTERTRAAVRSNDFLFRRFLASYSMRIDVFQNSTRLGKAFNLTCQRTVGYSDFHNLMGFTSKKMPNNILKNVC